MYKYSPSGFNYLPPIIKNIIIINVLFVLAGALLPQYHTWMIDTFALHNFKSPLFKPWQLLTHMFMHGDLQLNELTFMHLFFNMFSLWVFGSVLEQIWGSKRFLNFYLLCGIGAAVLHLLVLNYEYSSFAKNANDFLVNQDYAYYARFVKQTFGKKVVDYDSFHSLLLNWTENPSSSSYVAQANELINAYKQYMLNEPTVGASGAVFGILFAFGYLFPNTLLYIYFMIPIKAKYAVLAFALIELFSGIQNSAGDNVAHYAHLGGMLVAFIILKFGYQKNRKEFF